MVVLKWENEALEGLTAVNKYAPICADEHVACFEQDTLEHAHYIVDFKSVEQACYSLIVNVRELSQTGHAKRHDCVCWLYAFAQVLFSAGQV